MGIANHHSHMGNFEDYWTLNNIYHVTKKNTCTNFEGSLFLNLLVIWVETTNPTLHVSTWLNPHNDKSHDNNVGVVEHSVDG